MFNPQHCMVITQLSSYSVILSTSSACPEESPSCSLQTLGIHLHYELSPNSYVLRNTSQQAVIKRKEEVYLSAIYPVLDCTHRGIYTIPLLFDIVGRKFCSSSFRNDPAGEFNFSYYTAAAARWSRCVQSTAGSQEKCGIRPQHN